MLTKLLAQLVLRVARIDAANEDLGDLRLLRLNALRIDALVLQVVIGHGQHLIESGRVREGDKAKAARSTRRQVALDNARLHLAVRLKVLLQVGILRIARQSADENLPVFVNFLRDLRIESTTTFVAIRIRRRRATTLAQRDDMQHILYREKKEKKRVIKSFFK